MIMKTIIVNEAVERLRAIDRNSYIQKNKLMRRFDEKFHTSLSQKDADDLSFVDILKAPCDADKDMVYSELKKVVNHGLSAEDKEFLYQITETCLDDTATGDFDALIEDVFLPLADSIHWQRALVIPARFEDERETGAFYFYKEPFWMAEYFVALPDASECEAILVQNGYVLSVKVVHSLRDVPQLKSLLKMSGERFFRLFHPRE